MQLINKKMNSLRSCYVCLCVCVRLCVCCQLDYVSVLLCTCLLYMYINVNMDDGVVAGPKQAALQAFSIIKQLGPPLGLFIKCELFSKGGLRGFPDEMKKSNVLNFEILGAPIGDSIFCAKSIAKK